MYPLSSALCTDPPSYVFDLLYQLIEGAPGNIPLMLDARPLPGPGDFGWLFNGQPLNGSSNLVLTVDSLAWSTVSRNDSGEYTVSATNRAGTGMAMFLVQVICKYLLCAYVVWHHFLGLVRD